MANKPQNRRPWGAGRIAFLAQREAIRGALVSGHSLVAIYAQHRESLGIGYAQFTRYVRFYLRGKSEAPAKTAPAERPVMPEPSAKPKRFQFDPTAVDRKTLI